MYSGTVMKQKKTKPETCNLEEEEDPFHDKRRLLSYWKSLATCSVNSETGNGDKDGLLVELDKCLTELDDLDSLSNTKEQEAQILQNEQLSLLRQLGEYSVYFSQESSHFDLNDNFKNSRKENEVINALKAEKKMLIEKNESLVKEMAKQHEEYKASSKEKQRDIEKLTREIQNFSISRRKLERELHQITKQKNDNEATINSLRQEMKTSKESYETEMQKLSNMNEQVMKGKEATESLKIALQQLTEEKKAMQAQRKSTSGKDIREIEASLERAKKEREAFRQRCEKSELLQRSLQEEISSLRNESGVKGKASTRSAFHKEIAVNGGDRSSKEISPSDEGDDSLEIQGLQRAHSRISQLKKYVHVLEDRIKEKDDTILSLRKENAKANDVVMEKSLELSKSRRILERRIEKLTNENSDLKKVFIPNSSSRKREDEETGHEDNKKHRERSNEEVVEVKQRRRSNPEHSAVEAAIKRFNNETSKSNNNDAKTTSTAVVEPDNQDSAETNTRTVQLDVAPRRRIGGKFIRASSKRHSADLGKLMSRHEPLLNRKLESDILHEDEPATIFINKYRKKSEEEHWV